MNASLNKQETDSNTKFIWSPFLEQLNIEHTYQIASRNESDDRSLFTSMPSSKKASDNNSEIHITYEKCMFCKTIVAPQNQKNAESDKIRETTKMMIDHLFDNHQHLLFRCNARSCLLKEDTYGNWPNQSSRSHHYFVNLNELIEHMKVVHEFKLYFIYTSRVDLRKAACEICSQVFLCQGGYQTIKHEKLKHGKLRKGTFLLSCRACDFETKSYSLWKRHFECDYRQCINLKLNNGRIKLYNLRCSFQFSNFLTTVQPVNSKPNSENIDIETCEKTAKGINGDTNEVSLNGSVAKSKYITLRFQPVGHLGRLSKSHDAEKLIHLMDCIVPTPQIAATSGLQTFNNSSMNTFTKDSCSRFFPKKSKTILTSFSKNT